MTETQALPPPDDSAPEVRARRDPFPILYLIGFAVLALGILLAWRNPLVPPPPPSVDPAQFAELSQQLTQQLDALSQRLARLEQRPVSQPTDLRPLESRIAALEHREIPAPRPPPDLKPLEAQIAAVEQKIPTDVATHADLAAVEQKIPSDVATHADLAAVEQKIPRDVATRADLADLATRGDLSAFSTRVDAIAARQDQLAARQQGLETGFANRMDRIEAGLASRSDKVDEQLGTLVQQQSKLQPLTGQLQTLDQRLVTTEKAAGQVASIADRAARAARIQAAQAALEAGQPLGELPDAPPVLKRFATAKPPTEPELRLAFPAAAQAAQKASQPNTEGQPFLDRLWTRAQDLVTVREGDRVIVGDPAAGVVARARQALNAGDLQGAVDVLESLSGPAAEAFAEWKAKAKSLLEARAALASMAAQA
jgi:hypothetical protein